MPDDYIYDVRWSEAETDAGVESEKSRNLNTLLYDTVLDKHFKK